MTDYTNDYFERREQINAYHNPTAKMIREADEERMAQQQQQIPNQPTQSVQPIEGEDVPDGQRDVSGDAFFTIDEGDKTYNIENRADGFYVMGTADGERTFDGGLNIGKEDPRSKMDIAKGIAAAPFEGMAVGATQFVGNVARAAVGSPVGEFALGEDKAAEIEDTIKTFLEITDETNTFGLQDKTIAEKGLNIGGQVTGQFIGPALSGYGLFTKLGASPLVASVLADGFVGAFGISPEEDNLFNMIEADEGAMGALRDVMAIDENDPEFVNRMRNATEAIAALGVGEAVIRAIPKVIKASKDTAKLVAEKAEGIDLNAEIKRFIEDESGSVKLPGGDDGYRIEHTAPLREEGVANTLDDAVDIYGDEIYDPSVSWRYFGHGGRDQTMDKETANIIAKFQGQPEEVIEIFRAVPKGVKEINPGDWVTVNKNYAQQHGVSHVGDDFDVISKEVKAKDIATDGNSIHEWGYDPVEADGTFQRFLKDETGTLDVDKVSGQVVEKAGQVLKPIAENRMKPVVREAIVPEDALASIQQAFEAGEDVTAKGIDFNFRNMATTDDMNNAIDTISEVYAQQISKGKRGVQTFDKTQDMADMSRLTGWNVEDILNRQSGELWPAHKIKASRDIFVSEMEKAQAMATAIREGADDTETLIEFRRQLSVVSALQMQLKGVQTEVARSLSQFRMVAEGDISRQVELDDLLQAHGGQELNKETAETFLNLMENGGPQAAAQFARNADQISGWDILYSNWINSLLGSPTTHMVNTMGNVGVGFMKTMDRFNAATYASGERAIVGLMGKEIKGVGNTFNEAKSYAYGQVQGVIDGLMAFGRALRTGEGSDIFGKIDYNRGGLTAENINNLPIAKAISPELLKSGTGLANFVDFLGEYYFRLPGRLLLAEDEFFKSIAYRGEMHAQLAREALEGGLSPDQAKARMAEVLSDPQMNAPEIHMKAQGEARNATFTDPAGPIARPILQALDNARIGNAPVGRVIVPFFNVINNMMKFTFERLPGVNLLSPTGDAMTALKKGTDAERQAVVGKWITGAQLLAVGTYMAQEGKIRGRMTDNHKLLKVMKEQGKTPYSINIGDKSIEYNRFEPMGFFLAIASDVATAMAYEDSKEKRMTYASAAIGAILPYLSDKSFFTGITDVVTALNPQYAEGDAQIDAIGRYLSQVWSSAPGSVLGPLAPGTPLSGNVERQVDPTVRSSRPDPNTSPEYRIFEQTINKIMSRTPGLSDKLPPVVNIWGKDVVSPDAVGPDLLVPIYQHDLKFDKDALAKIEGLPERASQQLNFTGMEVGLDIDIKQHKEFVKVVGIDGELERLGMPLSMPQRRISAKGVNGISGLPVKLNEEQYVDLVKLMNKVEDPNTGRNMKEYMNHLIKQPEYATAPDDKDAKGSKASILSAVMRKYKQAAEVQFFEIYPELERESKLKLIMSQQTGVPQ